MFRFALNGRVLPAVILGATATAAVVFALAVLGNTPRAGATNPPSMDAMRLDMDPANTPANTATSIGTSETCARINENDILDADEDSVADRIDIDLTALNIPAANPMLAFNAKLMYNETEFTLATSNVNFLLAVNPGSNLFSAGDGVPDTNGNNVFNWSVVDLADFNVSPPEFGSGILARGGLETDSGAVAGLFQIDMGDMVHIDPANNAWFPDNTNWDTDNDGFLDGLQPAAFVAVNQACPLPPADIELVSLSLTSPANANAGTPFNVDVSGTVHNQGPNGPVASANVAVTLSLPADCTTSTSNPQTVSVGPLPVSSAVAFGPASFSVTCSDPSFHDFNATATVAITDPGFEDPNSANDGATAGPATTGVEASADPKVSGVTVTAPATAATGAPFNVTVTATLHNNGPQAPVNVDTTIDLAVPVDCTRTPNSSQFVDNTSLAVSSPTPAQATWSVTCTTAGLKTFTGTAALTIDQLHVADSNSNNNSGQGQATTDTSLGTADVKVTSVTVTSPSTAPINTNFPVTVDTIVHNNGPFFPINTDITLTLNIPDDCFTPITTIVMQDASLGPSIAALLPQVTFYVTCIDHSFHDFTATATIVIDDPLAGDPNPANNTLTSAPSTTAILRTSDLKVTGATIAGPAQAVTNTPFDVAVDASIHNNGPDPAPTIVDVTLTLPPDCTTPVNPLTVNLTPSVSVAAAIPTQTFPVTCTTRSDHQFEATASIAGPLHVVDPDGANNAAGTGSITVPVFDLSDLKVSSVTTNGPAQAVANTPFNVSATVNLHNNGPFGPVNADLTANLNLPADCTTADPNPRFVDNTAVPLSVNVPVVVTWSVTCTTNSFHSFAADASVAVDEFHVSDPDPGNNSGTSSALAVPVFVQADGKILSATALNPPTFIPANTDVNITVRKVLHNNGPFGPATFTMTKSVTPPAGCTVTPPASSNHTLSVSTPITVDEVWTVNCAPGSYNLVLQNTLDVTGLHVSDPAGFNNSGAVPLTIFVDGDGDGVPDDVEVGCGSNPNSGSSIPERIDGVFAGVDDDGDTSVDEPLPPGSEAFDCDGDGYKGSAESAVYAPSTQGDQDPCGTNNSPPTDPPSPIGWPADLAGGSSSQNRVNIQDIASYVGPIHYVNTDVGTHPGDRRWDVVPGAGVLAHDINLSDILNVSLLKPVMLGGVRALNGPDCPWPP